MKKAIILFQCVAEALVKQGIGEWAKALPGGEFVFGVAKDAFDKYRVRLKIGEVKEEVEALAQADQAEINALAIATARHVNCSERQQQQIATYLAQIPGAIRQSQKRSEDPSGRTVEAGFQMTQAADMVKILPPGLPKFVPGDALPGADWTLKRLLGVGGFGEVWLAQNDHAQKNWGAVKFCHSGHLSDHEVKLIGRLMEAGEHPHIVPLVQARTKQTDQPWLMYRYIEGGDLGDCVHRWAGLAMAERQIKVLETLIVLAKAIGYFHGLTPPIVHRDLKPANILRDQQDQLYITDFGIGGVAAQRQIAVQGMTTTAGKLQSALYGSHTPLYASSQQKMGSEPDPRDDVHALGVIGYQLLTGQMAGGPAVDFADDLADLGVSSLLIGVLKKCVSGNLERRLKNGTEVAKALNDLGMAQMPAASVKETSPKPTELPQSVTPVQMPQTIAVPATANQVFTFKTPFVDKKGKIIRQEEKMAHYFTEMLGEYKTIPLEMVFIPGGKFQMGAAKNEESASSVEFPQHGVTVPDFYMAKMPLTQGQYEAVMGNNPSHFKGANRPVEQVSWDEAVSFCQALAKATGKAYRLPSEAEWEYACRAGTTTPFCYGETITAALANYNANTNYGGGPKGEYREQTTEVGLLPPNGFGLYDMHGNVWEWCADGWHNYAGAPNDGSVWAGDDIHRVLRGGSWRDDPRVARAADRIWDAPDNRYNDLGFRLALGTPGQKRAKSS